MRKNHCKCLILLVAVLFAFGTAIPGAFAEPVPPDGSVAELSAGYMHSVLLKNDGTVWTWGKNSHGQLGDGTNTERTRPVRAKGLAGVVSVDAGGDGNDGFPSHTAAVKNDGTVWCWGANKYGQLGDGTQTNRNEPVMVSGFSNAVMVSAGGEFTAVLKRDGTVWCWGDNLYGQLGIGGKAGSPRYSAKPVQVMQLQNIVSISAAYSYVLAVDKYGTVWTWGENISRNPKSPKNSYRSLPAKVSGLKNIRQVGAGMGAIALDKDGYVYCWGDNTYGQLGNGYFGWKEGCMAPRMVFGLTGVVGISGGSCNAAAIKKDGTVWVWGDNRSGALGNNSCLDSATPVQVKDLTGAVQVACGREHTLALKKDGSVWSWGENWFGQLGDGTISVLPAPKQVEGISDVKKISGGLSHTLALKTDGSLWGWGSTMDSQLDFQKLWPEPMTFTPIQPFGLDGIRDIAAGEDYTLVVKGDGTVWGWGQNYRNQLGNGADEYSEKPVRAKGLENVVQVTASQSNSMALRNDGTVWVWGDRGQDYALNGRVGGSSVPLMVKGISGVIAIAADDQRSAVLKKDGTVWYWLYDFDSGKTALKQFPGIKDAVAVACGDQHVSVLRKDGTVWSVGNNQAGMLGGGTTGQGNSPVQAKNLKDVCAISAGTYRTLALTKDGTVWYWGSFLYGKSGGGLDEKALVPQQVKGIDHVAAIDAGGNHSVAIKEDGTVWCWGNNYFGQAGQPNSNRLSPVRVEGLSAY